MITRFGAMNIPFWFEFDHGNEETPVTGHWKDFFMAVRSKFNLSTDNYEIVTPEESLFGEVLGPENGTGLIGHFLRNESDLSLIPISATTSNYPYLDFTIPTAIADWKIVTAVANEQSKGRVSYETVSIYQNEVWFFLITCTILFPLLTSVWFKNKTKAYFDALFCSYMYLVQQDYDKKVVNNYKPLWACWSVMAFCLTSGFKGCLLSKTTLPELPMKIDHLHHILNYPNLKMVILKDTTAVFLLRDSKDPIMKEIWNQIIRNDGVKTPAEVVINLEDYLIEAGNGRAALLTSEDMFLQGCYHFEIEQKYIDRLRLSPESTVIDLFAFCIRRGFNNELTNTFKDLAFRFTEASLTKHTLSFEEWKGQRLFQSHNHGENEPLRLQDFHLAFVVARVGVCLSILALICEFLSQRKR